MHAHTDPVPFVRRVRQAQIGGGRKTYFIIIYFIRVFKRRPIGCRPFIRHAVLAWTTAFHTIRIDKYIYIYILNATETGHPSETVCGHYTRGRPRKFIISNLFIYLFFLQYWFIFDLYVCFTFSLVIRIALLYPVPDKIALGLVNAYIIRKKEISARGHRWNISRGLFTVFLKKQIISDRFFLYIPRHNVFLLWYTFSYIYLTFLSYPKSRKRPTSCP